MSESLYKNKDVEDDEEESSGKHDAFDIFGGLFGKVHIWIAILLFVLFVIINTSFFIEDVIKKINSDFVSMDGNLTSSGILIQGVFLSLGYIIIDLLVSGDII
jgi:hypothetical protein